jgi:hypothetical protein
MMLLRIQLKNESIIKYLKDYIVIFNYVIHEGFILYSFKIY